MDNCGFHHGNNVDMLQERRVQLFFNHRTIHVIIRVRHVSIILGRCEASWGEPERDMTISTRLSDSVFTGTHGLESALKSEYE